MAVKKAVFLDKDGTLIPDIPYNVNTSLIHLSENCISGLKALQEMGYIFVVITNQSGIASGFFNHDAVQAVSLKLKMLFAENGLELAGFYYCPHKAGTSEADSCTCRKPLPGLFYNAAEELDIDLSSSWMIGDILHDIEAGHRAGCKSILINNGNETEWKRSHLRIPQAFVPHIDAAAAYIIEVESSKRKKGHLINHTEG